MRAVLSKLRLLKMVQEQVQENLQHLQWMREHQGPRLLPEASRVLQQRLLHRSKGQVWMQAHLRNVLLLTPRKQKSFANLFELFLIELFFVKLFFFAYSEGRLLCAILNKKQILISRWSLFQTIYRQIFFWNRSLKIHHSQNCGSMLNTLSHMGVGRGWQGPQIKCKIDHTKLHFMTALFWLYCTSFYHQTLFKNRAKLTSLQWT